MTATPRFKILSKADHQEDDDPGYRMLGDSGRLHHPLGLNKAKFEKDAGTMVQG
jgi:hypothetical protein